MKISLIIATYNRSELLKSSLLRLCNTNLTKPSEIILIDDGSEDDCHSVYREFKNELNIKYIYNHRPTWTSCSQARNIALRNAEYDWILTSEPECLFIDDIIGKMSNLVEEHPEKVISVGTIYHGGDHSETSMKLIDNPEKWLKNNEFLVNEGDHDTNPTLNEGYAVIRGWVATYCALYKKEWLTSINGWSEDFQVYGWDDVEILKRLRGKCIGQYIAQELSLIHQWHPKLPPEIQTEYMLKNEALLTALDIPECQPNNPLIIANRDVEWGKIITR